MARAFAAIASGGHMVRPHVTNPTDLPPGMVQTSGVPDEVTVPLDPKNWEIITDAMAQVVSPVGTAALSQIKDVDMAGKTGSAQTISNMLKAKMSASEKLININSVPSAIRAPISSCPASPNSVAIHAAIDVPG